MKSSSSFIFIVFVFLLVSCNTAKECIIMDQSYVESSDHGYISFFVSNGYCQFFDKYMMKENSGFESKDRQLYKKTQTFKQSGKISNPAYYRELIKYLKKHMKKGSEPDGAVFIRIVDTNEKSIRSGTIKTDQYRDLKNKILDLNSKHDIPEEIQRQINLYFTIIEDGNASIKSN